MRREGRSTSAAREFRASAILDPATDVAAIRSHREGERKARTS